MKSWIHVAMLNVVITESVSTVHVNVKTVTLVTNVRPMTYAVIKNAISVFVKKLLENVTVTHVILVMIV